MLLNGEMRIYALITTLHVVLALWKTMLHFVTCRGRVLREGRTTFLSLPFTNRVIGRAVIKLRNVWPNPFITMILYVVT